MALNPEQLRAAAFLEAVYAKAQASKNADNLARWIDPDKGPDANTYLRDSILADTIQGSSFGPIYGVDNKRKFYKTQIEIFMRPVQEASLAWARADLAREEVRLGSLLLVLRVLAKDLSVGAEKVRQYAKTATLPLTTSAQMQEITNQSGKGTDTVSVRLLRVQYMNAVRTFRARAANPKEADLYRYLHVLMAHPRGVKIIDRLAASAADGASYATDTINECVGAMRAVRADLDGDPELVWRFPPAVSGGVATLVESRPVLIKFALAWAATRGGKLESALDIAGNAVFVLGLIGGPLGKAVSEVLDFVLATIGTAVSFLKDLEQDQAATATAFAGETEKLSEGSRGVGTLLKGAAAIIAGLAVPGAISKITKPVGKTGVKAVEELEHVPTTKSADARSVSSRGVKDEAVQATEREVASKGTAPSPPSAKTAAKEAAAPTVASVPSKPPAAATKSAREELGQAPRLTSRATRFPPPPPASARELARNSVPELPILPKGLKQYSKKEIYDFYRQNYKTYPADVRQLIDELPPHTPPFTGLDAIDQRIKAIHTAEANRMAGFAGKSEQPFLRSVKGVSNEGARISSVLTDNKTLTLIGKIPGGDSIVEFDSVAFVEKKLIEMKLSFSWTGRDGVKRWVSPRKIQDQMRRQAEFIVAWKGKWDQVIWVIDDEESIYLAVGIHQRLEAVDPALAERIVVTNFPR